MTDVVVVDNSPLNADWIKFTGPDGESKEAERFWGRKPQESGRPTRFPVRPKSESSRHLSGSHDQKSHGRKGGGTQEELFGVEEVAQEGTYSVVALEGHGMQMEQSYSNPSGQRPEGYEEWAPGHWAQVQTTSGEDAYVNGDLTVILHDGLTYEQKVTVLQDIDLAGFPVQGAPQVPGSVGMNNLARLNQVSLYRVSQPVTEGKGALSLTARPPGTEISPILSGPELILNGRLWTDDAFVGLLRDSMDASEPKNIDYEGFDAGYAGKPSLRATRIYAINLTSSLAERKRWDDSGDTERSILVAAMQETGPDYSGSVYLNGNVIGPPRSNFAKTGPTEWFAEMEAGVWTAQALNNATAAGKMDEGWPMTGDQDGWANAEGYTTV